jgi:hypothetical protein
MRYNPGMTANRKSLIFAVALTLLTFAPAGNAQGPGRQQQPPAAPGAAAGVTEGITIGTAASDADIERSVPMFCPPREILRGKDGKISGCSKCPTGTDFYGTGDRSQWELRDGTMWGHFTSASAENLIVSGFGCDSHAHNFGGSYVFTRRAGKLRLLKYDPALFVGDCHAFPFPDRRDFLVCKGGWVGQGDASGYIVLTVFDATGESKDSKVMTVMDTTGTCGEGSSAVVQSSEVKDIKFSTKENGELTGIKVTATLGNIPCNQISASRKSGATPASVKTYDIEFAFDGKQFHVAPQSKSIQALFEKD